MDSRRAQTCKACGQWDKFDFHVPDATWAAIVPPRLRRRVVCLPCFDDFAKAKGVDYSSHLQVLYFAGAAAAFQFQVISAAGLEAISGGGGSGWQAF